MFRSRTPLHNLALWLALGGVVLRSLVPAGFMPGWTGAAAKDGEAAWLIICPTSPLHGALVSPVVVAELHHDHAAMLAAQAADPHAHHHAGMDHGAMPMAADPHAGHDADEHSGHRIAAEHLSCPFAGAGSPALPSTPTSPLFAAGTTTAPDVARLPAIILALQRRLPPARAPPVRIDSTLA